MTVIAVNRNREAASISGGTSTPRWLGIGMILLGLGVAAIALLGPLVFNTIRYHASDGAANQIIGGDAAALVLVAPASIIAGILTLRGHLAGPVLALGPAVYAVYTYTQLSLGGDFVRYPGNSELFFPLYLGMFILAAVIGVLAWSSIDTAGLPTTSLRTDRALGIFLLVVAAFLVVGLHLPGLLDAWQSEPTATEYLADPAVFWLVKLMDLGIVVPAMIAIAVGILREARWAHKAKYGAVGWFAMLGSSVAGMAIVMQATADPAASTANTIAFGGFAAVGLAIALVVYRPLFRT